MREFPTPVILDQARERAALRCKNETTFRALKVAQVWHGLTGRFARNGGYGSIEESEILNLSPSPERFGVISGCTFLHRKGAQKQTCRQYPGTLAARRSRRYLRRYGLGDGAILERVNMVRGDGGSDAGGRAKRRSGGNGSGGGAGGRGRRQTEGGKEKGERDHDGARERTTLYHPNIHGNSRVTAAWPPYVK